MFSRKPEDIYNKIYHYIEKKYGTDKFSPTEYALDALIKYLLKHPDDCNNMKAIINAKCAANPGDKIADRISIAFKNLLNPKFRDEMANQGKLGDVKQRSPLIAALNQISAVANKEQLVAEVTTDSRPYSIMFVGDNGSGKRGLMSSFVNNHFPQPNEVQIIIPRHKMISVDNADMNLNLEIKGGQDQFVHQNAGYYLGYDGVVFVYDITDKESYDHLSHWLTEIHRYANDNICKIIVGNKFDLNEHRVVAAIDAKEFADMHYIPYIECSAITQQNVNEIFTTLGRQMRAQRILQTEQNQRLRDPIANTNIIFRK